MKEFIVREDVLAATLKYLDTKPYGEVALLIAALKQSKPIEIKEENKQVESEE